LEPFFLDEAAAVADHGRRMRILQEELQEELVVYQRWKAAVDRIREYDPKDGSTYYSRFHFVDLSTFDLDEECKSSISQIHEANLNSVPTLF
jgi:hypothetical protein